MPLAFTDEQEMLRQSARGFFARHATPERIRRLLADEAGFDRAAWRELVKMGWLGVDLPEVVGGLGLGLVEMAIIHEAAGERLCPLPLLASAVLAGGAILAVVDDTPAARRLEPIVTGESLATLAASGTAGVALQLDAVLHRDGGGLRLEGAAGFVPFGHVADELLVVARDADDAALLSLVRITPGRAGLTIHRPMQMDLLRPEAHLRFDGVAVTPEDVLGRGPADGLRCVVDRAIILTAAEQVGGAQRCLDLSLAHARERTAFGRPIGSFQAIKHRLADMAMRLETARSAVYYACCLADEGDDRALAYAAAMAKVYCSEAFAQCAAGTIQLHGGLGFTWEHEAHLLFKHAHSSAMLFGSVDAACQRLADQLALA